MTFSFPLAALARITYVDERGGRQLARLHEPSGGYHFAGIPDTLISFPKWCLGVLIILARKSSERFVRYLAIARLFSTRVVLIHQKIADRLGLTVTEFKCFSLIQQFEPTSATTVAAEAGLQLGTVSPIIERLEEIGFIERQRDSQDRRRVLIVASPNASEHVAELFRQQGSAMREYLDQLDRRDFELVMNFLTEVNSVLSHSLQGLVQTQSRGSGISKDSLPEPSTTGESLSRRSSRSPPRRRRRS